MCVIERFDIIHPSGFREPKEVLHFCRHGTPVNPCNNAVEEVTEDRFLPSPEAPFAPEPHFRETKPRREETRQPRKFKDGLKLVFDFHIPFTSRRADNKQRTKRPESAGIERRRSTVHQVPPQPVHPRSPTRFSPPYRPLQGQPGIVQVPLQQPPEMDPYRTRPRTQTIRPRQGHPLNVGVHQYTSSSSPSPETPVREHMRQSRRMETELREYENLKRLIRERERREHAERAAREAENARLRAEIDAELVRRGAAEDRLRIRHEERRRIESVERTRRRQEQENWEREQARLRQEQEDRERLQAAAILDDRRRAREENERLERLRRLNIPRGPRHPNIVNQRPHVTFEERGDRVINDAIQAENQRRSWRRAPSPDRGWSRRRDVGGVRRRDTVAVGQRQVYNDDRRRGGRRFV